MQHFLYTGGQDQEIIDLFQQAFTDTEGEQEGKTIGALVKRFLENTPKEDIYVFLTTLNNQLVGGVIFSKLTFEASVSNTWLLSPAAVATAMQGTGVGQSLIGFAHTFLKQAGVQQVVTYGDISFYSKVGYQHITERIIPSPWKLSYPDGWIAQSLEGEQIAPITGKAFCVEALNQPELW